MRNDTTLHNGHIFARFGQRLGQLLEAGGIEFVNSGPYPTRSPVVNLTYLHRSPFSKCPQRSVPKSQPLLSCTALSSTVFEKVGYVISKSRKSPGSGETNSFTPAWPFSVMTDIGGGASRCPISTVNLSLGALNRRPKSVVRRWPTVIVSGQAEIVKACGRSVVSCEHEERRQNKKNTQSIENNLQIALAAGAIETPYSHRHRDTRTCAQLEMTFYQRGQ